MLDRRHRLTTQAGFTATTRRGRRATSRTLVAHLASPGRGTDDLVEPVDLPRVGFVVSKAVGNAVTRNRVVRRLREQVRRRLPDLPAGSLLVVRALPAASSATSHRLADDLDLTLGRLGVRTAMSPSPDHQVGTPCGRRTEVGA